jgi:hypothetical protein
MKQPHYLWVVFEGMYFRDGYLLELCATRAEAERHARADGFKWNTENNLFLKEGPRPTWRRLEKFVKADAGNTWRRAVKRI